MCIRDSYKANQERLASGDINKVAEVVRDLWRRDQGKGLSAGEKRMLGKARHILVGELALAEPVDEKKVEEMEEAIRKIIDEQVKAGISIAPEPADDDEDDLDMEDLSFDDEK